MIRQESDLYIGMIEDSGYMNCQMSHPYIHKTNIILNISFMKYDSRASSSCFCLFVSFWIKSFSNYSVVTPLVGTIGLSKSSSKLSFYSMLPPKSPDVFIEFFFAIFVNFSGFLLSL